MNKVVLIIDDDEVLRDTLARGLRGVGFDAVTAESAEMAEAVLARMSVDAMVLDRMMTGKDGLTFLKEIRTRGNTTPVIMLTAMSGAENAIGGLTVGADDYLAKPFQFQELVLRLKNIVKKSDGDGTNLPDGLSILNGEFFANTGETVLSLGLSAEEKRVLSALVGPVGNVVEAAPMVAKRLRTKLNSVLSNIDIITIRGRGYKMVDKNGK